MCVGPLVLFAVGGGAVTACDDEHGWRFEDLPALLAEARSLGIAVLGGQVQFKLPDSTCELYWQNADASPRRDGETWDPLGALERLGVEP